MSTFAPMKDMLVSKFMSSPVRTIRDDAPLADAHRVLREYTLSSLAVLNASERLVGVISRSDLLRVGRLEEASRRGHLLALPDKPVHAVMTAGAVTLGPDATVREAAEGLVSRHIHRVYVTQDGALVGVFSTRDAMEAVRARGVSAPLSEFMSTPVMTVSVTDTVAVATDRLRDAHVAGLVVIDEEEAPVGVFTQVEALQCRDDEGSTPVEDRMSFATLCLPLRTSMSRAAANAAATRARRVIAVDRGRAWGVLTGIDFARALIAD